MTNHPDSLIPIHIKFYSTLKKIAKQEKLKLEIERGTSLKHILRNIQEDYFLPNNARILDSDNQKLAVGMICLLNETDFNLLGGLRNRIEEEMEITLISSLHGG